MYLFEEFIDFAPYVISAIHKTFSEIGITNKRLKPPFKLYLNDKLIFDEKFLDFNIEPLEIKEVEYNHEAKLFIKTPIRVKENNRFLGMSSNCNARFCYINPKLGGAEACLVNFV